MAERFYILPLITNRPGYRPNARGPAYVPNFDQIDYGPEDLCLCNSDVTPAEHAAIAANADAVALPADLSVTLTAGQVTAVKNAMEVRGIPNAGITTSTTGLQVMKRIARLFKFAGRLHHFGAGRILASGVTLDTQFNNLPVAFRKRLTDASDSLQLDESSLSGASTLREILFALGEQIADPIVFRGQVY